MKKRVRLWLIVFAIGAIASAFIVIRLNRIITVSEVQITKDYTIEETPYKDSIVCTDDGTLLGSVQNSYTGENYIFISNANTGKPLSSQVQAYIPTGALYWNDTDYAQRGNIYYLFLENLQSETEDGIEYAFVKINAEVANIEVIDSIRTAGIPRIIDFGEDTLLLSYPAKNGARMKEYSILNNEVLEETKESETSYRSAVPVNDHEIIFKYNRKVAESKYKNYLGWADTDGNILDYYNLGKYFIEKIIIKENRLYVLLTYENTIRSKLLTADLDFENEKFKNIRVYRLPKILDAKFTTYDDMTIDAEKQRLNFMVEGPFAWDWSSSFLGAAYINLKDGEVVPEVKAEIITNLNRNFYPECTYIGDDTTFYFSNLEGELLYMKASS